MNNPAGASPMMATAFAAAPFRAAVSAPSRRSSVIIIILYSVVLRSTLLGFSMHSARF